MEIGSRIGVSQMQVSRLLRTTSTSCARDLDSDLDTRRPAV